MSGPRAAQRDAPQGPCADPLDDPAAALLIDDADDSDGPPEQLPAVMYGFSEDPLKDYLRKLRGHRRFSDSEAHDLITLLHTGQYAEYKLRTDTAIDPQLRSDLQQVARDGRGAREQLIGESLRMVVSLAKRYTGRGVPFLDLIQAGNVGLIVAVDRIDPLRYYGPEWHSRWWILQSIRSAAAHQAPSTVTRTPALAEHIAKMGRVARAIAEETGHPATDAQVRERLEWTPYEYVAVRQAARPAVSLDRERAGRVLGDLLEDPGVVDPLELVCAAEARQVLEDALRELPQLDRDVLQRWVGLSDGRPATCAEIGARLGLSSARAAQIVVGSLALLRRGPLVEAAGACAAGMDGRRVAFAGRLATLTRTDARSAVVQRGGAVDPSITDGTDCLVVGRAPGAALEEANRLGVQVLDEDGFMQWLAATD